MQPRFDDLCLEDHDADDEATREIMSSSPENLGSGADATHTKETSLGANAVGEGKQDG